MIACQDNSTSRWKPGLPQVINRLLIHQIICILSIILAYRYLSMNSLYLTSLWSTKEFFETHSMHILLIFKNLTYVGVFSHYSLALFSICILLIIYSVSFIIPPPTTLFLISLLCTNSILNTFSLIFMLFLNYSTFLSTPSNTFIVLLHKPVNSLKIQKIAKLLFLFCY